MQIVLKHSTNNSDHGETIEVDVIEKDWEDDQEIIVTDKGTFARSIEHSISSPYGWKKAV